MEIVKLIGSDVLPDDQKLILEIARVIRLGFLQQDAFDPDDTCVSLEKQFKMMDIILSPVSEMPCPCNDGTPDFHSEGGQYFREDHCHQV